MPAGFALGSHVLKLPFPFATFVRMAFQTEGRFSKGSSEPASRFAMDGKDRAGSELGGRERNSGPLASFSGGEGSPRSNCSQV